MKNRITKDEAIKIFSSTKRTQKLLDKTLSNTKYEYLLKSEEKGSYSLYSGNGNYEICTTDDSLKCFMGLLYFEFGVGKDNLPTWAMHSGFAKDNWNTMIDQIPKSNYFSSLNSVLDNGSTLYCTNTIQNETNNYILTNPFNESYASKISINDNTFSHGLEQINSLANLIINNYEQSQ